MSHPFKFGDGVRRKGTFSKGNILWIRETRTRVMWFHKNDGAPCVKHFSSVCSVEDLEATGLDAIVYPKIN